MAKINTEIRNLWAGLILNKKEKINPYKIMKMQALFLEKHTNNKLCGNLDITNERTDLQFSFVFSISMARSYQKYPILYVRYDYNFFPCEISHDNENFYTAENQSQFEQKVKEIFASNFVVNLVQTLFGQN